MRRLGLSCMVVFGSLLVAATGRTQAPGPPEVSAQTAQAAIVLAHAPAAVIRRQRIPSQNAMPICGAISSQMSRPLVTLGSQNANATPPNTTKLDMSRATIR